MRRLHRAELGQELDRGYRTILSMTPQSGEEYFNAAFARATAHSEPLRLSAPDSFLLAYTSRPGLGGTLMLARVDASGTVRWKADTGIDRFKLTQILPHASSVGFTGTGPPVANKVSEPILVVVDTQSGSASTSSLWK